jgi:hypothetical protein
MIDAIVTTALRQQHMIEVEAIKLSAEWNIPYVKRGKSSINSLYNRYGVSNIMIIDHEFNLILHKKEYEPIKYHPGMSIIRIKRLKAGNNDPMIDILKLKSGDTILDCTLGLSSDAILAQYVAQNGQVTGLESNKLLALFTHYGLQNYHIDDKDIQAAMKRIQVINCDYNDFLENAPDNSFDYVYFDPMFRNTVENSNSMQVFKSHCCNEPLNEQAVKNARRIARKMIILKERTYSQEFSRLGFKRKCRPNSSFSYGIIEIGGVI